MLKWKNALAIVNPKAGRWGSEKAAPRLLARVFADNDGRLTVRTVSGSQDARTWAEYAAREGFDLIVVCGGDGTLNETLNGLAVGGTLPVAILPTGTGNVLATELGIPKRLSEAVALIYDGTLANVDCGDVTSHGRRFAFSVSMGYGSKIIADARTELKNLLGFPAYALTGLKHLLRIRSASFDCRLDGEAHAFQAQMVLVVNVPMAIVHVGTVGTAARPDDGLLDVLVFSHRNLQELVSLLAELVRKPKTPLPGLRTFQARTIEISSTPPLPVLIDGDPVESGPISIAVRPRELQVVVPKKRN